MTKHTQNSTQARILFKEQKPVGPKFQLIPTRLNRDEAMLNWAHALKEPQFNPVEKWAWLLPTME